MTLDDRHFIDRSQELYGDVIIFSGYRGRFSG